jgi:hypothetical protein
MMEDVRSPSNTPFGVGAPPYAGHADRHILTTHFPTWNHILRFIDRDPEIFNGFTNMYPRVVMQRDVREVSSARVDRRLFLLTWFESSVRYSPRKREHQDRRV